MERNKSIRVTREGSIKGAQRSARKVGTYDQGSVAIQISSKMTTYEINGA